MNEAQPLVAVEPEPNAENHPYKANRYQGIILNGGFLVGALFFARHHGQNQIFSVSEGA